MISSADRFGSSREATGDRAYDGRRFTEAREVFEQVALADEFVDFPTSPAYIMLD
jgi:malate synthase